MFRLGMVTSYGHSVYVKLGTIQRVGFKKVSSHGIGDKASASQAIVRGAMNDLGLYSLSRIYSKGLVDQAMSEIHNKFSVLLPGIKVEALRAEFDKEKEPYMAFGRVESYLQFNMTNLSGVHWIKMSKNLDPLVVVSEKEVVNYIRRQHPLYWLGLCITNSTKVDNAKDEAGIMDYYHWRIGEILKSKTSAEQAEDIAVMCEAIYEIELQKQNKLLLLRGLIDVACSIKEKDPMETALHRIIYALGYLGFYKESITAVKLLSSKSNKKATLEDIDKFMADAGFDLKARHNEIDKGEKGKGPKDC